MKTGRRHASQAPHATRWGISTGYTGSIYRLKWGPSTGYTRAPPKLHWALPRATQGPCTGYRLQSSGSFNSLTRVPPKLHWVLAQATQGALHRLQTTGLGVFQQASQGRVPPKLHWVLPQATQRSLPSYTVALHGLHQGPSTGYRLQSTPASVSAQQPPATVHLCSHGCCLL